MHKCGWMITAGLLFLVAAVHVQRCTGAGSTSRQQGRDHGGSQAGGGQPVRSGTASASVASRESASHISGEIHHDEGRFCHHRDARVGAAGRGPLLQSRAPSFL